MNKEFNFKNIFLYTATMSMVVTVFAALIYGVFDIHAENITMNGNPTSGWSASATILLVEQNARQALKISHRAYVLETGEVLYQGTGKELLENNEIQKSYLGS